MVEFGKKVCGDDVGGESSVLCLFWGPFLEMNIADEEGTNNISRHEILPPNFNFDNIFKIQSCNRIFLNFNEQWAAKAKSQVLYSLMRIERVLDVKKIFKSSGGV